MGKSYAFEQEQRDLEAAGLPVQRLDLGKCGTDAARAVAKLAAVFQMPTGATEWHVLLDGLDEGLDNLLELEQLLIEQVEGLEDEARRTLRLRISCRTARWPPGLQTELCRLWAADQVVMVGLAPLSRDDVTLAARAVHLEDPAAFSRLVQQRGLVALAIHPMTLRQMLTSYTSRGTLPAATAEAYSEACLHLCKETRRPKRAEIRRTQASAENLFAVATRVAAALQFGPYVALADGAPSDGGTTVDDLELSRLAPGDEPGHLGSPVPCTMNELSQLTESSLLRPLGDYRWEFAHMSYQEFLAAEFLRRRDIQAAVERELLWIGDGTSRHILPAHQEVAAWRSDTSTTVFEDLLRDDPLVLLLADLARRTDRDRARVVDALLTLLKSDDTVRIDSASLHRLDHPQLAEQLRPYLKATTEVNLLYGVVRIARACRRPELSAELLILAEDRDAHAEVRVAALTGISAPQAEEVQRIRALSKDESPEVVAAAIRQLWPTHITLAEFLSSVRDPDPHLIGRAYMLRREIPELINVPELDEAITWARDTLCESEDSRSRALAVSLLGRGITLAGQEPLSDAVLSKVTEALLGLAGQHELLFTQDLHTPLQDLAKALGRQTQTRRSLAELLITRASAEQFLALHVGRVVGGLLPSADALYWMEHWDLLSAADEQVSRLAVAFPPPEERTVLERAQAARASHPTLRAATAFWDNPLAESPWEREHRELREAERRRNTYSESALRMALDAVLTTEPDQLRSAWAQVVSELHHTADGSPANWEGSWLAAVTEAPCRPSAGTHLDGLLSQAALHVLSWVSPLTAENLVPYGAIDFRIAPELTALALVDDLSSVPPQPARWAGWTVALATIYPSPGVHDTHRRLLRICGQRAEAALFGLVTAVLDCVHDDVARTIARTCAELPLDSARPALHSWARHPDRRPEQWQAVLSELAVHRDAEASLQLAAVLADNPADHAPHSPEHVRWMLAAVALLHLTTLPIVWPLIRRRLDDPVILDAFLHGLTRMPAPSGSWPNAVALLPERDVADFYRLLVDQIGIDTVVNQPLQSGFVGDDDRLRDMARTLPNVLVHKGTLEAATVLRALSEEYPGIWQLRVDARAATRTAAARYAQPIEPEQLIRLADTAQLRWIADERHLLDIVLESLDRFAKALHRPNGLIVALWNRARAGVNHTEWWPCWEEDFSDIVASFLLQDIGGHRVVINREVQVRRPGFPGLRTDIQIEAPALEGAGNDPIKVVIECKGCWNDSLDTALANQLVAGYLQAPRTAGVFLTAYFHCDRWGVAKQRKCPAVGHSLAEVRQYQEKEAEAQRQKEDVSVIAVTLDCALPASGEGWRSAALAPARSAEELQARERNSI
ncbi:hypothetical protein ACFYRY_39740 [Streptomyces sp. NPDC005263]|uniref:hypothetical protein n=1 Tax=Streptomyces sp. NPDC005263 TaxID=3364711 RepID=UPI0036C8AD30